ncbi:MAG TPA: tetratricopeptide repeat protein [Fimbriimonadaceae bacterium]|nr:tetratricopeptide repeat protein [Fimbriimonadaceae bacterium]
MNPSFRQIAELFNVVDFEGDSELQGLKNQASGKTAAESEDLGKLRLSEGDYQNAIRHFKEAMSQRDSTDIDHLVDLAGAYDYGDLELQAFRQYRKALKTNQESPEPLLGLADILRRSGRFRDSVAELEKAIKLEPGNPYYHIKLAEALREMGEPTKALAAAQYAVVVKPEEPFYHYWIGDLLLQLKRYEEALQSFRAAIELSPGDDHLYLRAAVAFWRTDRKPEAIKAIRLASDLDPEKHLYAGMLEALLAANGENDLADLESERADKMDRYDHDVLNRTLHEMGIVEYDPMEG